jgi:multisubunit Na+/H+ antiporter MnhG subunit
VLQAISGFTLWVTKPAQYLGDVMFDTKFTLVIVACIAMIYFHATFRREVAAWDAAGTVTSRGIRVTAIAFLLWAAVTIGGRLTAYLGSLYLR